MRDLSAMSRSTARFQAWALLALLPAAAWVVIWLLGSDGTSFDFGVSVSLPYAPRQLWRAAALIGPVAALVLAVRGLVRSVSEKQHAVTAEWAAIGAGAIVLLALATGAEELSATEAGGADAPVPEVVRSATDAR